MGLVIRMQSYRDYDIGLLTKEEMLEGKTFYPEGKYSRDYRQYSMLELYHLRKLEEREEE